MPHAGHLKTGCYPITKPKLNNTPCNVRPRPDRNRLPRRRHNYSIRRMNRKYHPVIVLPPCVKPRQIVIKHGLRCDAFDLNEGNFV